MSAVGEIERRAEQAPPGRKMPSRGWIGLGIVIGVLGLAAAIVWSVIGVTGYLNRVNDLSRMPVPGQMTVQAAAGEQFVYLEGRGSVALQQLGIRVTDPRGRTVALQPYHLDLRYDAPGNDGRIGHALATFQAPSAGVYGVSATGIGPVGSTIAVGESVAKNVIPILLGIVVLLLVMVAGGLSLVVVTLVRRSQALSP